MSRRRGGIWWLLSVEDLVFLLLAGLVLCLPNALLSADGDLARHIRMGDHVLRHGVRITDVFSHTRAGDPFLAYEWLSEVVFAAAHRVGGLGAVLALSAVLIGATYALIVRFVRRSAGDALLAFTVGIWAAALGAFHWLARPHLVTFLALAVLLHLRRLPPRRLWAHALLFAVWANAHPGFVLGLVVLAFDVAGRSLDYAGGRARQGGKELATAALALLVASGATLLTPFGLSLHPHILQHLGNDFILSRVAEFHPLSLRSAQGVLLAATFGVAVVAISARERRLSWATLGLFVLLLLEAMAHRRNVALFGIVALPLLAVELAPVWKRIRIGAVLRLRQAFTAGNARARSGAWAGAGAVVILSTGAFDGRAGGAWLRAEFSPSVFPVEAVARARAARLEGTLFNHYGWGGYVLYAWPEQRIFIDGMMDHFGDAVLADYGTVVERVEGWREVLDRRRIDLALLPANSKLAAALKAEPGWRVWHEDPVATVLVRDPVRGDPVATASACAPGPTARCEGADGP